MGNLFDGTKIELGVCYYPEHWDKVWRDDLRPWLRKTASA